MIVEPAPAKLNLALHVRRRRDDGYHDIETLFAFCRDGDVVAVEAAETDCFAITGPFAAALPSFADEGGAPWHGNLVTSAVDAFRRTFDVSANYRVMLEKNLPIASGVGGGSADAAATLRALASQHGIAADDPRLIAIARALGADVSACLAGHAAFGSGRGDDLTPVAGWADVPVLLVNPRVALSTGAVFAAWDGIDRGALDPDHPTAGRNDLEGPARRLVPAIDAVLAALAAQAGTTLVRMSGSGATCFALFRDRTTRDAAAAAIAATHPQWWRLVTRLT